ncbi:DUF502 domain-containing protein [Clostridium grantii]|uniref:Uncharacterized membrane protein n=1 Tax=Clostridium grantii DSM 8605 TaxID=1121316 RepID=A0A1M5X350_9CLOT|nr:DUF502 domain-containing protein [Clostridium grantii]SHH94249.1 Uncharacterized membrane protein [Clostridium grantii DSM 8605]
MKKVKNLFLSGLAASVPIAITYYILKTIFLFIDSFSKKIIIFVFGKYYIGLGFLLTIGIILLIGFVTSNVIGKKIFDYFERAINKLPIVNSIYASIKELSKTFSSSSNNRFSKVVMVDFPKDGIKSMGFITNDNIAINDEKKVAVFIPTTPNPTNGFLVFVDIDSVEKVDITVDEAIKTIISMSTLAPEEFTSKENKIK